MENLRNLVLGFVGLVMLVVLLVFFFAPQFAVQNVSANPEVVWQLLALSLLVLVVVKLKMLKWLSELWYWLAGVVAFVGSLYVMLSNEPIEGLWRIVFLLLLLVGALGYLLVLLQKDYEHD